LVSNNIGWGGIRNYFLGLDLPFLTVGYYFLIWGPFLAGLGQLRLRFKKCWATRDFWEETFTQKRLGVSINFFGEGLLAPKGLERIWVGQTLGYLTGNFSFLGPGMPFHSF